MTAKILQFPERRREFSWTSGSTVFCELPAGTVVYDMTSTDWGVLVCTSTGTYVVHEDGTYTPVAVNL